MSLEVILIPRNEYNMKIWPPSSREVHRLRVSENKMLRRIFGRKRDEVTEGRRKLLNEGLNNKLSLPSIIRMIK
jgi:hypothetical protein